LQKALNRTHLLIAISLILSCGDSPSEPENTPTPSILSAWFTGETDSPLMEDEVPCLSSRRDDTGGKVSSRVLSHCQVTANWTSCPDEGFQSYALYRSTLPGIAGNPANAELLAFYTDVNQRTHVDEDLDWGITYYYAVRTGNNEDHHSWSNEAEIQTPGDVPTPSVLTAISGFTQVTLEWTECPDPNFSRYTLYRSSTHGIASDTLSATKLCTFDDPGDLSFIDTRLTEQSAIYALRTTNTLGTFAWSEEVSADLFNCCILAWGEDYYGQCDVPPPNEDFVAMAGGWEHSLGLREDGSIVAWGSNQYGQCSVPDPNGGFIAVAAGAAHSLGLQNNSSGDTSTIVAWGTNESGQCDVPSPNTGFVGGGAGGSRSLGLNEDGSIVAWGWSTAPVPVPNEGFTAIASGDLHSLGLKEDGSIVAWGNNEYGQCNVPYPNERFVAIAAGGEFSLGLKDYGVILAWGRNNRGQCDVPSPNTGFVDIAAGGTHSLGLKDDGSIFAWGDNLHGQCNVPEPNENYKGVAAGIAHSLGLRHAD